MKYFIFLVIYMTSVICQAQAPSLEWAFQIGDGGQQLYMSKLRLDSEGNMYSVGQINGNNVIVTIDGKTVKLNGSLYLMKLSPNKEIIWVKTWRIDYLAWSSLSIDLDKEDNIYFTSTFYGTFDADPNESIYPISNTQSYSTTFLIKLNKGGQFTYATKIGDGNGYLVTSDLAIGDNEMYINGQFEKSIFLDTNIQVTANGEMDAILICLNLDGTIRWHKNFGSSANDYCRQLAIDKNNDVIASADFYKPIYFEDELYGNDFSYSLLTKFNAKGEKQWIKQVNVLALPLLAIDTANHILVTGAFSRETDFDPSDNVFKLKPMTPSTPISYADVFVLKLSEEGKFQWVKALGTDSNTDYPTAICVDQSNNVFVDIYTTGPNPLIAQQDTFLSLPFGHNNTTIIFKEDGNIKKSFTKSIPTLDINMNLMSRGLITDKKGNLYQAGSFSIDLDVDAGPKEEVLSSKGSADYFYTKSNYCKPILKTLIINSFEPYTTNDGTVISEPGEYTFIHLKNDGCDSTTIVRYKMVEPEDILKSIKVLPNLFFKTFTIYSDCGFHGYNISLYASDGKLVFTKFVNEPNRIDIVSSELSNVELTSSMYFLHVSYKKHSRVFKLVKM